MIILNGTILVILDVFGPVLFAMVSWYKQSFGEHFQNVSQRGIPASQFIYLRRGLKASVCQGHPLTDLTQRLLAIDGSW